MAIHTVVRGVELAADEPLPEWRLARIEDGAVRLGPCQHVSVGLKTSRKILEGALLQNARIFHIRLRLEAGPRIVVLLLFPVDRDLRLADVRKLLRFGGLGHVGYLRW